MSCFNHLSSQPACRSNSSFFYKMGFQFFPLLIFKVYQIYFIETQPHTAVSFIEGITLHQIYFSAQTLKPPFIAKRVIQMTLPGRREASAAESDTDLCRFG